MRKSEAVQLRLVSSCHDVQSDSKHKDFESAPNFVAGKVSSSSIHEVSQNDIERKGTSSNELEDGELIEGIEANDVSALLEQFLEYEEKQGSMDCSTPQLSSLKDTSCEMQTVSDKINSFAEKHELKFDIPCDVENRGLPSLAEENSAHFHSAENKENQEVHGTTSGGSSHNDVKGQDENSKTVKNSHVDNHATDHNYACSGSPLRKPIQLKPEDDNTLKESILKCSPQKSLDMENHHHSISEETGPNHYSHKRRLSCDDHSPDRKRRLPKRYRGAYCEESCGGKSSCDEEYHYREMSTDKDKDHKRQNSYRKFSYSSDGDRSCYKGSNRRHSMCSNDSYDGREYSSSDEECKNERTSRYDPRRSESDWRRKQSSGSDREADHHRSPHNRRRRRRSRSKDPTEKRNGVTKNKTFHDIEFERKLEFKFDHNIRNTAKEERRIVYIGKISNKTTKDDVFSRFRPFGPIEKVTVHFREKGDNYAFVTFFETSSAAEAIERGNEDSRLPILDLCFGGRRKFCGGSYVDFDSNASYLEEQELSRPPSSDEMDFDALLRMSQKSLKSRKESCKGRYMY